MNSVKQKTRGIAVGHTDVHVKDHHETVDGLSLGGLVLIGVGGIIGAGYFLGIGLAVVQAGPGILLGLVLGALIMSQVLGAVTSMSVNHPVKGSFRTYAEEMFGPFIGYFQGWLYWLASVLTIGSEAIAMAVFARLWVPQMPMWALALIFTGLIFVLNAFGVAAFSKLEGALSALKIVALIMFCLVILLVGLQLIAGTGVHPEFLFSHGGFLPHGIQGVLQSMLIVIFAFSGIGVMATATSELRKPRDASLGATLVIVGLFSIYFLSLLALLTVVPWWKVSVSSSPFVLAFTMIHLPLLASLFNAVILVAAFTVMAGALFSAVLIMQNMAHVGEAPRFLRRKEHAKISFRALVLSALGAVVAIMISYVLPSQVYSYLVSATSYITFFNWVVILLSWLAYKRRHKAEHLYQVIWVKAGAVPIYATIIAIVTLTITSLGSADQRMGGAAALLVALIIAIPYPLLARKRKLTAIHLGDVAKDDGNDRL